MNILSLTLSKTPLSTDGLTGHNNSAPYSLSRMERLILLGSGHCGLDLAAAAAFSSLELIPAMSGVTVEGGAIDG